MSERENNEYILGIDFGTCYSFPACVIGGEPKPLLMNDGAGIPTLYYYNGKDKDGKDKVPSIGNSVNVTGSNINNQNLVQHIKLDLVNGNTKKKYTNGNITCVDICSSILANIVSVAESKAKEIIGNEITFRRAAITIPFIDKRNKNGHAKMKQILKDAAKKSRDEGGPGLEEVMFIYEPVAAALYYAEKVGLKDNQYVLVYDLGGGTCDLSLVKKNPPGFKWPYKVISQGRSDDNIGGEIFDKEISDFLRSYYHILSFVTSPNTNLDNRNKMLFMDAVRVAKERLSPDGVEKTDVYCPCDNYSIPNISLTKDNLNKIIGTFVDKTVNDAFGLIEHTHNTGKYHLLDKNNTLNKDVAVIMVGGSSHIPLIKEKLKKKLFGHNSSREIPLFEPHNAIAYGAAIYAEYRKNGKNIVAQQVHESYGIRVVDYRGLFQRRVTILRNDIISGATVPTEETWRSLYIDSLSGENGIPKVTLECYINYSTEKKLPFEKAGCTDPLLRLEFNLDGIDTLNELQLMYCLWINEGNDLCAKGKIVDSKTKEEIDVHVPVKVHLLED